MTTSEMRLWGQLERIPLPNSHFRRQAPIGPYVVDFVCHHHRLVIEIDGGHHGETAQAQADALRTAWLSARGYRVLRFWNADVASDVDAVLDTIYAALYTDAMTPGREAGAPSPAHSVPDGAE